MEQRVFGEKIKMKPERNFRVKYNTERDTAAGVGFADVMEGLTFDLLADGQDLPAGLSIQSSSYREPSRIASDDPREEESLALARATDGAGSGESKPPINVSFDTKMILKTLPHFTRFNISRIAYILAHIIVERYEIRDQEDVNTIANFIRYQRNQYKIRTNESEGHGFGIDCHPGGLHEIACQMMPTSKFLFEGQKSVMNSWDSKGGFIKYFKEKYGIGSFRFNNLNSLFIELKDNIFNIIMPGKPIKEGIGVLITYYYKGEDYGHTTIVGAVKTEFGIKYYIYDSQRIIEAPKLNSKWIKDEDTVSDDDINNFIDFLVKGFTDLDTGLFKIFEDLDSLKNFLIVNQGVDPDDETFIYYTEIGLTERIQGLTVSGNFRNESPFKMFNPYYI